MAETYITLQRAAELEGIGYETMKKRIQRSPREFKARTEPRDNGGKPQVTVALSSLSSKARKAHRASEKIKGRDVVIEAKTQEAEAPWYLDIDLNWYIENHREKYYKAVELASQIGKFVAYNEGERTSYAEAFAKSLGVSSRSLYRYAESYLEAAAWALKLEQEQGGGFDYLKVLALCRKPKDANTFPSLTEEMRAVIENIWFDKGFSENIGTVEMLYWKFSQIGKERGWPSYPSYPTVTRYVNHIMSQRGAQSAKYLAANGTREWKNKQMLKGKRDATALQVMEFVQGDEHTLDLWVSYTYPNGKVKAVRPMLVAWVDTRSRTILGDVFCVNANSQTLKESLVKMVYSHPGGVPKHLHIDNGKDYTAKTNTGQNRKERGMMADAETLGFYRSIGISEWSRSLPYEPWGKAQMERFFGTVCNQFSKWFASYTGTLTGSKTEGKRHKDIDKMLERGELYTMEELYELWTKWKDEVYHQKTHSGLKKDGEQYTTPISLFENGERYHQAAPPREFAAMLLMNGDRALVRNQGITKFGTIYTDYELAHYVGQTVNVKWDIDDVTKLYVYTLDGRKICDAVSAELLQFMPDGVSQKTLEEHIRSQKRQYKETQRLLEEFRTPYELRATNEDGTPAVVGGFDLTMKPKRSEKVMQLPTDKEFRGEVAAGGKKKQSSGDEFYNQKAQGALERLRQLG